MTGQRIDLRAVRKSQLCRCVVTTPDGSARLALPTCLCCRGSGLRDSDREKTMLRNANRRIPTWEEFYAFDGAHCKQIYASLDADWRCPACRRNKYELLRWTMLFPNSPHRYEGWAAGFHKHHDHRADPVFVAGVAHPSGFAQRFPATILCEQCNSADAAAKRKLKLPKQFSFSPAEIALFVIATPHGWHLLDYDIAAAIYVAVLTPTPATNSGFWPSFPGK